jgi:hypothetical protein
MPFNNVNLFARCCVEVVMFKHSLLVLLLCSSALAHAQQPEHQPDRDQSQQQRRAAVRAATKESALDALPRKERSTATRQLSPQERAELRQQLRQQRRDNPKQ